MAASQWGHSSTSDRSVALSVSLLACCFSAGKGSHAKIRSYRLNGRRKQFWIIGQNQHPSAFHALLLSSFWSLPAVSLRGDGTNLFAHHTSHTAASAEMTLSMQFRLPPGITLLAHSDDLELAVEDGDGHASVYYGEKWFGPGKWHLLDGDRQVLLASAELNKITYWRKVTLRLPNVPEEV